MYVILSLAPWPLPSLSGSRLNLVTDTRTHLSNLERLLHTHAPPPPPPLPQPSPQARLFSALRLPLQLIFPQSDTEEVCLSHLRHLLSDSAQRPSPRRSIASRWRDLHGCAGWSGLVDPLEPDLRRELLRYGDFIHSAYHAFFHSCAPQLPDRSYRLTRHLFATSSIVPPRWLPAATFPRSSWIGFVAVCESEREITRMGRRDIVIALRGTSTWLEWAENLRAHLVPLDAGHSKVACGFRNLYTTPGAEVASLSSAVADEIRRLVKLYQTEPLSITVTGHSLGAALAVLVADELSSGGVESPMPPIAVFSFGGPKVGNRSFAERVEGNRGFKVLRVVNARDFVTRVPAAIGDGYEHVGRELKVDSKVSPILKPDADPVCCHDLEAYLHLVDGLGGGDGSQFRPNAKRSLVRLLNQQQSNVKKLYVSQSRALGLEPAEEGGRGGLIASLGRLPDLI